jgi:hypothetical protein
MEVTFIVYRSIARSSFFFSKQKNAEALSFHFVKHVGIRGVHISIQHHQNGQSNSYFSRSNYHNEEYEYLSVCIAPHARKSNECQVHCIEHELYAHKHDDGIAAKQNAKYA